MTPSRDKEVEKRKERIRWAERYKKMYFCFIGKRGSVTNKRRKELLVKVAIVQFFRELTGARGMQSFTLKKNQGRFIRKDRNTNGLIEYTKGSHKESYFINGRAISRERRAGGKVQAIQEKKTFY